MSPAARWFAAVRAAYGLALLCWPGQVTRLAQGAQASGRIQVVARVLGGRHLAQATVTAARPSREVLALGAGTDLAHAASMLALAATGRRGHRAALADAAVAVAFAMAGSALARDQADPDGQARPA